MQIVTTKRGPMFFADTAVIPSPSAEDLAEIALMAAKTVRRFGIEPVIAMLSYSNFGTDEEPLALKVTKAVEILHNQYPELLVEGEMKADIALDRESRAHLYPFNNWATAKSIRSSSRTCRPRTSPTSWSKCSEAPKSTVRS